MKTKHHHIILSASSAQSGDQNAKQRTYHMKTNHYWSAIVATVLITEVLFSTAVYSLPGPDDYKKLQDEVNKAAAKPTPRSVVPGPEDYKMLQDEVNKAAASSKAGALPAAPAPDDVNKAVNAAKGNPDQSSKSEASSTSTQTTNLPYTFYDRYTPGSQKPNSTSTSGAQSSSVETHESSWSDMQGQHKKNKNKKKHHDDDQDQFDNVLIGDYQQVPSQSHSHSASHKTADSTYDGSPVLYNKPKPTSDTEDWHKKNKNEHHHHDGDGRKDNAKPQGQDWLYLNLPKDGTDKKKHHHHGDD